MRPLIRSLLTGLGIVAALYLFAASAYLAPNNSAGQQQSSKRVALFVNGTLGDKSFYDSAARGLASARSTLGMRTRVVEGGHDPTRWEAALADLADSGDFDLIITGTYAMAGLVQKLADRNPQARFVLFDAQVDTKACQCRNVHSLLFRQREASFLAGHLAARVITSEARIIHPASTDPKNTRPIVLGAVGGLPIPVVDDFIDGFAAGARHADPQVTLLRQYANSFSDPATAKDIAKTMYAQGAGLVFQVAGGSGQGVIEAAAETGRWAIGVDSDQYALYREAYPARAQHILSSVLKNVDAALLQALRQWQQGTLAFGVSSSLGLAEGGVSLAHSGPGWQALPPALAAEMAALAQAVADGSLRIEPKASDARKPGGQR